MQLIRSSFVDVNKEKIKNTQKGRKWQFLQLKVMVG